MAIVEVTEDWSGDTYDESMADEGHLRLSGVATRVFDVVFDSDCTSPKATLPPAEVLGLPKIYDLHPGEDWLFVTHRRAERIAPLACRVYVDYTSVINPMQREPEYSWDFVVSSEPVDRDNSDKPILNSAEEPFDPPVNIEVYDLVLRYRNNIRTFDPVTATDYIGAVNSDMFYGFDAGQVKCTKYTGTPARAKLDFSDTETSLYYIRDLEFVFRRDSWQRKFLDEGFRIKTGTDAEGKPKYKIMEDEAGKPLSMPVKLDGAGGKLNDGLDAKFLTFDIEKTAIFSSLTVIV